MKAHSQFSKRYLAFLCVALILACTLSLFLPHDHAHMVGAECEVCAIIDSWRGLLFIITLLIALAHHTFCLKATIEKYTYIVPGEQETLVGQKVKLSN